MSAYASMTQEQLSEVHAALQAEYEEYKAQNHALNMARGKPASDQLALSRPMFDILDSTADATSADGTDCMNYGVLDGLPEAKQMMSVLLDDDPANIFVGGNSSLNLMYDMVAQCWAHGALGSTPWCKLDTVKWLCPSPGYDRHFAVVESFGIEMIAVPMLDDGPDMDVVEKLVADDAAIKGIWCVPKYSNPSGITYSDEVVKRLASMPCAAEDFRIFWDNAYAVHHLYDEVDQQDQLLDIGAACVEAGNPNRYYKFGSTSKVTLPGAGVAGMAMSPENLAETKRRLTVQTIGYDKLNQLRHARFLDNGAGVPALMSQHAALLRPKFELVDKILTENLTDCECGTWDRPRGGYFISFDGPEGTAKRAVALAKEAGVVMTGAGATFPYGNDPKDSNVRIAPTLPPLHELEAAMQIFCCCVKLATVETLLA